jgi:hypothetical protein
MYERDVVLRDSLIDGVLTEETKAFQIAMDKLMNESVAMQSLRESLTRMEYLVFVIESMKRISDKLHSQGSLPLPASLSPLDIAHPVVLGLFDCGILMMRWIPFPRIVATSPTSLVQMEAWCTSQLEDLPIHERASYNGIAMRNRIHIDRQLDKLSR